MNIKGVGCKWKLVAFRVSEWEYNILSAEAEANGLALSKYMRGLMRKGVGVDDQAGKRWLQGVSLPREEQGEEGVKPEADEQGEGGGAAQGGDGKQGAASEERVKLSDYEYMYENLDAQQGVEVRKVMERIFAVHPLYKGKPHLFTLVFNRVHDAYSGKVAAFKIVQELLLECDAAAKVHEARESGRSVKGSAMDILAALEKGGDLSDERRGNSGKLQRIRQEDERSFEDA